MVPQKRLPVGINHVNKRLRTSDDTAARRAEVSAAATASTASRAHVAAERTELTATAQLLGRELARCSDICDSRAVIPQMISAGACADRADVCIWRPVGPAADDFLARAYSINPRVAQDDALETLFAAQNDADRACQRIARMALGDRRQGNEPAGWLAQQGTSAGSGQGSSKDKFISDADQLDPQRFLRPSSQPSARR